MFSKFAEVIVNVALYQDLLEWLLYFSCCLWTDTLLLWAYLLFSKDEVPVVPPESQRACVKLHMNVKFHWHFSSEGQCVFSAWGSRLHQPCSVRGCVSRLHSEVVILLLLLESPTHFIFYAKKPLQNGQNLILYCKSWRQNCFHHRYLNHYSCLKYFFVYRKKRKKIRDPSSLS